MTFEYVYGFCVRLCTAFVHVVRILRTYTAYLLRKLCGFWFIESLDDPILRVLWFVESIDDPILRVLWFYIVRENNRDSLKVSMIRSWGSVKFFVRTRCSLWLDRLEDPIFRVPSSSLSARAIRYDWAVSRIRYFGFRQVLHLTICSLLTFRS